MHLNHKSAQLIVVCKRIRILSITENLFRVAKSYDQVYNRLILRAVRKKKKKKNNNVNICSEAGNSRSCDKVFWVKRLLLYWKVRLRVSDGYNGSQ